MNLKKHLALANLKLVNLLVYINIVELWKLQNTVLPKNFLTCSNKENSYRKDLKFLSRVSEKSEFIVWWSVLYCFAFLHFGNEKFQL